MAALRLEDLIKQQQKMLALGDKQAQATIDRLEEIAKTVAESEKIHKQDRVLQVAQTIEAVKADKDDDRIAEATEKGLIDKTGDGVNANVIKLIDTIKKQYNPSQGGAKGNIPESQDGSRAEQSRKILEERSKEQAARYFPTFNEKLGYVKPEEGSGLKGMFNSLMEMFKGGLKIENFVDMKAPPSGLFGGEIRQRVEKAQYVKDRLATEQGRMLNLKKYQGEEGRKKAEEVFSRQYDEQRIVRRSMSETEKEIERLRSVGMSDDDIARAGLFKQRELSDKNLQGVDAQYRAQRKIDNAPSTGEPTPTKPVSKPRGKTSKASKPDTTPVAAGALAAAAEGVASTSGQSLATSETEAENARLMADQTDILKKIEENTRGLKAAGQSQQAQAAAPAEESGGGLSDLFSFGTKGLKSAGKLLGRIGGKALGGLKMAGGAIGSRLAPALASAGGVGGIAAAAAPAAIAYGAANLVDWGAGKFGIGKDEKGNDIAVDTKQDDSNWNRMNWWQKAESGMARGVEKVGSFVGFDNFAREAQSKRIATETEYLQKTAPVEKANLATNTPLGGQAAATASKEAQVREQATKLGLDPNKAEGKFEGGALTQIIDTSTGESYNVQVSPEQQRNVDAARSLRGAMQGSPVTPQPVPPRSADAVYNRSEENAAAAQSPKTSQAPVVISAPQTTNVQQTQNYLDRGSARNTESSWRDYNKSKYAY